MHTSCIYKAIGQPDTQVSLDMYLCIRGHEHILSLLFLLIDRHTHAMPRDYSSILMALYIQSVIDNIYDANTNNAA